MDVNGWVTLLAVGVALSDRRSGTFIIGVVVLTAILIELDWVKERVVLIGTFEVLAGMAWYLRWVWWEERKIEARKDADGEPPK